MWEEVGGDEARQTLGVIAPPLVPLPVRCGFAAIRIDPFSAM
jgi:hypothetical protein